MKLKFDIKQFAISLVISPVVFYLVIAIAKLLERLIRLIMENLIIWIFLAILIKISFINKK